MPRRVARALLGLASLAVGLVAGELLVRAFGPAVTVVFRRQVQPSENPVLDYELRPGASDGRYRISADGLRDRDLPREKPAGEVRIAAIGDSITFANGVKRERGWTEQLERLLNVRTRPDGPRFEVLNLGIPGYNTTQVVERLRRLGLAFEPDLVVYAYALNDPQAFSLEGAALRAMREEGERVAEEAPALRRWLARSRLFLLLRELLLRGQAPWRPEQMPADPVYEAMKRGEPGSYLRGIHREGESARRWPQGLADLAALVREHDLPALVLVFPMFPDDPDGDALADVTAEVAAEARRVGLDALDLAPFYTAARHPSDHRVQADILHPNLLGHRIAAFAVLDRLCRAPLLPPDSLDCARVGGDPVAAALGSAGDEAPPGG